MSTLTGAEAELLTAAEEWADCARLRGMQSKNWAGVGEAEATYALKRLNNSRGRLLAAARAYAKPKGAE